MDSDSAKGYIIIGVVLIIIALLIGPTSTTTETICDGYHCYDIEYHETSPFFLFFAGIGGIFVSIAFWWLVVYSAVSSGTKEGTKENNE